MTVEEQATVGKINWWAPRCFVRFTQSALYSARIEKLKKRPTRLWVKVPSCQIERYADVGKLEAHSREMRSLVAHELVELEKTIEMPGLLSRMAPLETVNILPVAAERIYEIAARAHHFAYFSGFSVVDTIEVQVNCPGMESYVQAWNNTLKNFAERFLAFLDTIPAHLTSLIEAAEAGEARSGQFSFDMNLDLTDVQAAYERMVANMALQANRPIGPRAGKVYALLNFSMPGLVKIGKTKRDVQSRAEELATTGVPTDFIVLYEVEVDDCDEAERVVHAALSNYRVSGKREFFRIAPTAAVDQLVQLKPTQQIRSKT